MARSDSAAASDAIWPGFNRLQTRVMRLVLIDDHPVVREGVCALLSIECDMRIVGDAGDIDSGIELVRRHEPDLVVCDLNMPGCTGATAVQRLCQECPTARVLVLSAHDSLECMRQSFMDGAIGYVRKTAVLVDLLSAVRRAAGGRHAMCRGVSDTLTRNWLQDAGLGPTGPAAELAPEDRQSPPVDCNGSADVADRGRLEPWRQSGREVPCKSHAPSEFEQRRCRGAVRRAQQSPVARGSRPRRLVAIADAAHSRHRR